MVDVEAGWTGQGDSYRMSNKPTETDTEVLAEALDPTIYEPRYTEEHIYLDTDALALTTITRENSEYDDSHGDAVAERMVRVHDWVGDCRETA